MTRCQCIKIRNSRIRDKFSKIRDKFELLVDLSEGTEDVLIIPEIKIESSFSAALIHGFSQPYMTDRNSSGGGIMFYVREELPSNLTKTDFLPIEDLYIELKLRKGKWFIVVPIILIEK